MLGFPVPQEGRTCVRCSGMHVGHTPRGCSLRCPSLRGACIGVHACSRLSAEPPPLRARPGALQPALGQLAGVGRARRAAGRRPGRGGGRGGGRRALRLLPAADHGLLGGRGRGARRPPGGCPGAHPVRHALRLARQHGRHAPARRRRRRRRRRDRALLLHGHGLLADERHRPGRLAGGHAAGRGHAGRLRAARHAHERHVVLQLGHDGGGRGRGRCRRLGPGALTSRAPAPRAPHGTCSLLVPSVSADVHLGKARCKQERVCWHSGCVGGGVMPVRTLARAVVCCSLCGAYAHWQPADATRGW